MYSYCGRDQSLACAYFFFDSRDSQNVLQLHESLICSVLIQLCDRCNVIPNALSALYKTCHSGSSQPPVDSLHKTLMVILDGFQHVYIIIDALDECTQRQRLMCWLKEIISLRIHKLHLLATSRSEEDIAHCLRSLETAEVDMASKVIDSDIQSYLDWMFHEDVSLRKWNEEVQNEIKSTLLNSAKGMYDMFYIYTGSCLY